jgi:hypothetical protein
MRSSIRRRCGECRFSSIAARLQVMAGVYIRPMASPATFRFRRHRFAPGRPRLPAGPGRESSSTRASRVRVLAIVADGMGGKSGGRKAADQVLLTGRQIFERYVPAQDDAAELAAPAGGGSAPDDQADRHHGRRRAAQHGGRVPGPGLECDVVHAGDSRVYHFRGAEMMRRTTTFLRAAPDRRRQDHRRSGQHAPAVQPADRLPGHPRRPAGDAVAHRQAGIRRHHAGLQRRPVALLHAQGNRRHRARPAPARSQRDADQQGAPARPRRRRQPVAGAAAHRPAEFSAERPSTRGRMPRMRRPGGSGG